MTGPYVQYRVLEVKITVFFFLVTSCEENLVILNLLDPLAVVPAKTHRTRPRCFKTLQLSQSHERCLNCQLWALLRKSFKFCYPVNAKIQRFLQNIFFWIWTRTKMLLFVAGVQKRDVHCILTEDGSTASDDACELLTKPATTQECNNQACEPKYSYLLIRNLKAKSRFQ